MYEYSISDYVDFNSAVEDYSLLPFCEIANDSEASMNILEHLEVSCVGQRRRWIYTAVTLCYLQGMSGPPLVNYIAERGLEEVLHNAHNPTRYLYRLFKTIFRCLAVYCLFLCIFRYCVSWREHIVHWRN